MSISHNSNLTFHSNSLTSNSNSLMSHSLVTINTKPVETKTETESNKTKTKPEENKTETVETKTEVTENKNKTKTETIENRNKTETVETKTKTETVETKNETESNKTETYDAWSLLEVTSKTVLDKGRVELVDFSPRICPVGWTPEYAIVKAARVSFGKGLTTPEADEKLCRYLLLNQHTSPVEMVSVTLILYLPIAINIHFLRHRTGKFNQFSHRYSVAKEEFYNPLAYDKGIRLANKEGNKQGSTLLTTEAPREVVSLITEANALVEKQYKLYHLMLEAGLASEIARFWLPMSQYTTTIIQFDLNNLLKLLTLRSDEAHAQHETVQYSNAILELVRPLFPTCFRVFDERRYGMTLTASEVLAINTGSNLVTTSVSESKAFLDKKTRLGL